MAPEKHLHLARLYEKLGEQVDVAAQTGHEFNLKAKWHRILARRSSSLEQPAAPPQARTEVDRLDAEAPTELHELMRLCQVVLHRIRGVHPKSKQIGQAA